MVLVVKNNNNKNNPLVNTKDLRNAGSTPGSGRFSEEELATHSSILAWRIPWTEEPGRLQCIGSQRLGHDLAHKYANTRIMS